MRSRAYCTGSHELAHILHAALGECAGTILFRLIGRKSHLWHRPAPASPDTDRERESPSLSRMLGKRAVFRVTV